MVTVEVKGTTVALGDIRGVRKAVEAGVERGLKKAGLYILQEAQELVPVDKGDLRRSGFTRAKGKGFQTEVRTGYTDAKAVEVHENLDYRHGEEFNKAYIYTTTDSKGRKQHNWTPEAIARGYHTVMKPHPRRPQEQAKFLERPVREKQATIAAIVRKEAEQK